ncbi:hypothetical protein ACLBUT_27515, partial [Pseudomonas aeruginosa]
MNDPQGFEAISRREQGLQRRLSAAQRGQWRETVRGG